VEVVGGVVSLDPSDDAASEASAAVPEEPRLIRTVLAHGGDDTGGLYNRIMSPRPARSGRTPTTRAVAAEAAAAPRSRADALPDLSQYGTLAEYNRKRRFAITPEPPGRMPSSRKASALAFVVQKHRASHLHYDFRLEHEGAMLSWAVPKGPSLDPTVRRLAMQTEPHPMDYNQFEGVIPEGEYGGGTVMIWDHGTWEPEVPDVTRALQKGDLKFRLRGKKLRGSWVLVRTRDRNWLLIKHRDAEASVASDLTVSKPRSVVSRRTMAGIARAAGATPRQLAQALGADPTS
jgi:DNA ligase D-like protein (predicted 3'-phosphoesterase)